MRFGDLEMFVVSDGRVRADAGGIFGLVPRSLYGQGHQPDEANELPMNLRCLLLRSRGLTILIDTGLGPKLGGEERGRWKLERPAGGLLDGLGRLGIAAEDVDIVINTHLHWYHCGGNTSLDDGAVQATFPRAVYWIQRIEWAEAANPDARTRATYLPDNFGPLVAQGRVRFLHGDTPVTDQVHCVVTRGHTRGHQSVLMRSYGWQAMYVADMATYAAHMTRTSLLTAYDVEPLENVRTKQRWQRHAV